MIEATAPYLIAPGEVEFRQFAVPEPGPGQLRVATIVSGISPGTELLGWRGQLPEESVTEIDHSAPDGSYPMRSGYASVGRVIDTGVGVDADLVGTLIFSFQPHGSHFLAAVDDILRIPDGLHPETATLIPNLETAVNLVLDARPILGEQVVVLGQGVVGLLTTALLATFPLRHLITCDGVAERRRWSLDFGATASIDQSDPAERDRLFQLLNSGAGQKTGADLVFELTGNPAALNDAISLAGYAGRVIVGSWYGRKQAPVDLGGHFHRNQISLASSQVSTIAPRHRGRWDRPRRFDTVLSMMERLDPARLITHRFPAEQVARAYQLIDTSPEQALHVLLTWDTRA